MAEENYNPRPLGLNWLPCYVCGEGGKDGAQPDMAAFVDSQKAGERVVAIFQELGSQAKLDFRPSEPNWIQVKIGACERHRPNLVKLARLCSKDKKIDLAKIADSLIDANPS